MYLASAFLLLFFTAILCCTWCLNELIYWSKLCACQEVLNLSRICTLSVEHIWIVSSCSCSSTLRPLGATLHTTAVTHFFSCDTSGARCLQGDSRRNVRVHAREALIILVFNSVLCFFMRIKVIRSCFSDWTGGVCEVTRGVWTCTLLFGGNNICY